jgi:hypothetical protein
MGGTTDKSTPLWMPWREARKRAGSFDALRPYLHLGRIPVRHSGLFTFPEGKLFSGPGDIRPEWWAHAHEDRAERVIFITEPVVSGYAVIQEQVFAYSISIELDSVAFDTCFPVATVSTIADKASLPPAERKLIGPADWFRNAIKDHPKQPNERASDYAARLFGLMKTAPVTKQWTQKTLYRRLYDK